METTQTTPTSRRLSRPLVTVAVALFAAGAGAGWLAYLDRSPVRARHVAGTSAWWQHAIVAAVGCLALGLAYWRSRRTGRPLWLLAPLGARAAQRTARLFREAGASPAMLARAVAALPPAVLVLYGFFRSGLQVTGGLDPNATVNAWGGPTYAGAMACHYLDALVIMAAMAWLLDRILPAAGPGLAARPGSVPGGRIRAGTRTPAA